MILIILYINTLNSTFYYDLIIINIFNIMLNLKIALKIIK